MLTQNTVVQAGTPLHNNTFDHLTVVMPTISQQHHVHMNIGPKVSQCFGSVCVQLDVNSFFHAHTVELH